MTYFPASLYTFDSVESARLNARLEYLSPDHYEIYRDRDGTVHVVKIIDAAFHSGLDLEGVEFGSLADLTASITYWESANHIDDREGEPLWTASRPPAARGRSFGISNHK